MSIKRLAGALALLVMGMLPVHAQGVFQDFALVGSWRTQIDIPDRPGGGLVGVMLVHVDGTMLYSDITQVVPQKVGPGVTDFAFTTPSYGGWVRTRDGYDLQHLEVLASPNTSLFGTCTTEFAIQLTNGGVEFKGTATFTCADATGQQAGPPASAPISGKRIGVAK